MKPRPSVTVQHLSSDQSYRDVHFIDQLLDQRNAWLAEEIRIIALDLVTIGITIDGIELTHWIWV